MIVSTVESGPGSSKCRKKYCELYDRNRINKTTPGRAMDGAMSGAAIKVGVDRDDGTAKVTRSSQERYEAVLGESGAFEACGTVTSRMMLLHHLEMGSKFHLFFCKFADRLT